MRPYTPYRSAPVEPSRPPRVTLAIPSGEVTIAGQSYRVRAFRMDRHLVSQGDYRIYSASTGAALPPALGSDDLPVVHVSAEEAAACATWAGGRLATEAEWQLAAAGFNEGRTFPWGDTFRPDRGPTSWGVPLAERLPRVIGSGAPLADGVFGLSDLGEVWEMTAAGMPGPVVVRGGAWRDRLEPPRLDNRSTEIKPARDVGFRCVYPLAHAEKRMEDWYFIPRPRTDAATAWRGETLTTLDGLRAYLEQELTRLDLAFHRLKPSSDLRGYFPYEAMRTHSLWETAKHLLELDAAEERAPSPDRLAYEWGDSWYYKLYVERGYVVVTHSRKTAGVDAPYQGAIYGETSTRIPLEAFIKLDFDVSDFVRYVCAHFAGNFDSPT